MGGVFPWYKRRWGLYSTDANRRLDFFIDKREWNILSIGDSAHEREALIDTRNALGIPLMKSLKFMEKPSPKDLIHEHDYLLDVVERICTYPSCLDLYMGANTMFS